MAAQPNINWSSVWTGITQAAIIGSFVMISQMYVNQKVSDEKMRTQDKKNEDQDVQLVQIWAILNRDEGIRISEGGEKKQPKH